MHYSGGSATRTLRKKPNPEVRDSSLKIPRFLSNTFFGFRWGPIEPQQTQGTLVQFRMVSWHAPPLYETDAPRSRIFARVLVGFWLKRRSSSEILPEFRLRGNPIS